MTEPLLKNEIRLPNVSCAATTVLEASRDLQSRYGLPAEEATDLAARLGNSLLLDRPQDFFETRVPSADRADDPIEICWLGDDFCAAITVTAEELMVSA